MKHYVIVSDIHCPYQCPMYAKFIERLLIHLKNKNNSVLKGIVQLGDFVDFFQISSYPKDPSRKNTIAEDMDCYVKVMNSWASHLPVGGEYHQIEGNHENRLSRFISQSAPAIHELVVSVKDYLKQRFVSKGKFFWHEYKNWKSCKIGNVVLMHGFYYNTHVAATNLAKYKVSTIFGHTHRFQYVTDGDIFSCTLGHGSDEGETAHQPTPTSWNQACGVLTILPNGTTHFEPILIKNGKGVYGGKQI
jgi:predicted phosphodiesterase